MTQKTLELVNRCLDVFETVYVILAIITGIVLCVLFSL